MLAAGGSRDDDAGQSTTLSQTDFAIKSGAHIHVPHRMNCYYISWSMIILSEC